ncbi:MAG: DUF1189 domain-containing protein [Clostridia bacterium]|jgi:hypothetical protein|nr:DUF1189 domain-containing protein [Clostridia bacterium]
MKEEKQENTNNGEMKKGFFKKIWYSIDKVEKYSELSAEGFGKAIRYLITLIVMLAIVSAGVTVFRTSKQMKQVSEYIKENAPEFKYSDGILDIDINEPIINENENFGKIIVDTISETEDIQNQYMDDIKKEKRAVVVLKDKLILKETENNIVYKYEELFKELNISEFSKDDLASYLVSSVMMPLYLNLFLVLFIYALVMQAMNTVFYIIIISIFGYLTSMILRLKIRYVAVFNMAVYSITLPTLLYIIYLGVNAFVNYVVPYFEVMYMLVATIYMIAALFILKSEFNKKQGEVQKIIEIEKEIKEDMKQEENKKQEKEENKNKNKDTDKKEKKETNNDTNNGEQPEGSNA